MLIKRNYQLSGVIRSSVAVCVFTEEVCDIVFGEQRTAQNTEDFEYASVNFQIVFDNAHEAICNYSHVDLYADGVFIITPKTLYSEMLLYPFEEQFDLPSIFVKQSNGRSRQNEVVSVKSESCVKFRCEVNYSSKQGGIFFKIVFTRKTDGLITQNIVCLVQSVFPFKNFITTMSFLTNYEKRVHVVDTEQTCKVKVAFVKDIAGKRFIFDIIHGIDIMHFCLRYEKCDRYLGRNVQLGVNLDSGFRTFKQCPIKQRKTQGNGGRIESIEFSWYQKFAVNSLFLSNSDHMISEFLENGIISGSICPRQCCKTWNTSYSQMIRFIIMGTKNTDQFSGTSASIKLSEHQYQQLVPMCKLPVFTSIGGILHQTPKKTLGNKLYYLTENIFAIVHSNPKFVRATNVAISNRGHTSICLTI